MISAIRSVRTEMNVPAGAKIPLIVTGSTPATRARMAEDATRVVTIVKVAGRDFRNVARHAYESIVEKEVEAPKAAVRRKTAAVKRATRKTVKRARKAA